MKKIFLPLAVLFFAVTGHAQQNNPYPRTITVTGSAEMEVTPDEIYVQVDLKEYEKKGQGKISLDRIRNEFLADARAVGIADSAITISAYDANAINPWYRKKNKKDELYASITYLLKIRNSTQLDQLVERLDDLATQNFFIERTSHSRIAEYRRQLKIDAVKAAREKAGYLTEAAGESLGVAVTIQEPTEFYVPFYNQARTANAMIKMENDASGQEAVDFRKIKLKYEVTVVFALK